MLHTEWSALRRLKPRAYRNRVMCLTTKTPFPVSYNSLFKMLPFIKFGLIIRAIIGLWTWSADSIMFILSYEAAFYESTILKVHLPCSRITTHATMPRKLIHTIICFLHAFDPNEWFVKCSVFSEGFEPNRPLSHESCSISKTMASCHFADYIAIFLSIFNKKKNSKCKVTSN